MGAKNDPNRASKCSPVFSMYKLMEKTIYIAQQRFRKGTL